MPLAMVDECFNYIAINFDENVHESYGILSFLKHKGIPILTTIPVTVQHIGDDSLFDPDLPVRRTTRFEEHPEADWTNTKEVAVPDIPWFKPAPASSRADFLSILKGVIEDDG